MEKKKFSQKYGVWFFLLGIVVFFIVLKLIGFPEIMWE
jgi:hypothetical protein